MSGTRRRAKLPRGARGPSRDPAAAIQARRLAKVGVVEQLKTVCAPAVDRFRRVARYAGQKWAQAGPRHPTR